MIRSTKFWFSMAVFQMVFGLAVFAVTRQHYLGDPGSVERTSMPETSLVWPGGVADANPGLLESSPPALPTDPVALSRQGDEFFASRQYDRAADAYGRLLALAPDNVDTMNNLGITLHYLGRSTEALGMLNQGVALDPAHQRSWLTLGFVNSQLGAVEQARISLTNAIELSAENELGQSAQRMLDDLP